MSYIEICECGCTKEGHFDKKGACLTRGCDACKQYRDRSRSKNVSAWDELRKGLPDHKIEPPAECGATSSKNPITAVQRCYDKPGHEGAHRSRNGFIWRDLDTIKLDITIGDTVTVNGKSISHPTLEEFVGAADGMKAAIDKVMSPPSTVAEAVAKLEAANPGDKITLADSVYDAMSSALTPKDIYATARALEKTCKVPYAIHARSCECDDCEEYNVDDPVRLAQAKAAAEHEAHAFAGIDLASNDDESAIVIGRQDTAGHKLGTIRIIESFKSRDPDRIAKAFRDSMMAWSAALRKDPLKQE